MEALCTAHVSVRGCDHFGERYGVSTGFKSLQSRDTYPGRRPGENHTQGKPKGASHSRDSTAKLGRGHRLGREAGRQAGSCPSVAAGFASAQGGTWDWAPGVALGLNSMCDGCCFNKMNTRLHSCVQRLGFAPSGCGLHMFTFCACALL